MDRVAHRLLEGDDRRVEPVRLHGVGLGDDDELGEPAVHVGADDPQVATQVRRAGRHWAQAAAEQVRLDPDQVALAHPGHAGPGRRHPAGQLVAEDDRGLDVLRRPRSHR